MNNKSLIIIGPGKYFGKEISERFGKEGFSIGLIGRREPPLLELKDYLTKKGIRCEPITGDVTNKNIIKSIKTLSEKLPEIKCVIFNVKGSSSLKSINENPLLLARDFEINVVGAWNAINACAKLFKNSKIEMILTGGGYKDKPDMEKIGLSISKAALHNLFIAMQPALSDKINLKTLVIDGYVREDGPIYPKDVAERFWQSFKSKDIKFIISPD